MFPLRPGTKVPAVRHWEHEATTDTEQIKELWTAQLRRRDGWYVPEPRNVGIACGPSALVVLDLDLVKPDQDRAKWSAQWRDQPISSGTDVLTMLADQVGQSVPETYVVSTPSGGRHLYFAAPEHVSVRNSTGHLGPMIDVRGTGGYVVAAGSRLHPRPDPDAAVETGELAYRLVHDLPAVQMPGWVTDASPADRQRDDQATDGRSPRSIRGQSLSRPSDSYGAAALRGESNRVRSAPVGQRNHTLNAAAYSLGQLVAAGALDQARAVEALTAAAADAGLESDEIAATIGSGLSAGLKRPRSLPERHAAPVDAKESVGTSRRDDASDDLDAAPATAEPATVSSEQSDSPERQPSRRSADVGVELMGNEQLLTTEQDDMRAANAIARRDTVDASGPSEQKADPPYIIDEIDAAHAGWLFAEAWDSFCTGRQPCYPADTLRIACEWEGLPTLSKEDRRFGPRSPAPFVEAPGEELVDRDVWESWSQAQADEWYFSRYERRRAAAADTRRQDEFPAPPTLREAAVAHGVRSAGVEETSSGHLVAKSALDQPVDADALPRALLAVLQSGRVIDRATWDATVTAVAERSAAAESCDNDGRTAVRRSDPPASVTEPPGKEVASREMAAVPRPGATSRVANEVQVPDAPADAETQNKLMTGPRPDDADDLSDTAQAAGQAPTFDASDQPESLKATTPLADSAEPVRITLYVDELLANHTMASAEYEEAHEDLLRYPLTAEPLEPPVDWTPYAWQYVVEHSMWTPTDPAAPAWSWETWRAQTAAQGVTANEIDALEHQVRPGFGLEPSSAYLDKFPEAGAELRRLEMDWEDRWRDAEWYHDGRDLELLEQQRRREWTAYGQALQAAIEAPAAARGVAVPVEVTIDLDNRRPPGAAEPHPLESRLLDEAMRVTPTPADLPGAPLDRLSLQYPIQPEEADPDPASVDANADVHRLSAGETEPEAARSNRDRTGRGPASAGRPHPATTSPEQADEQVDEAQQQPYEAGDSRQADMHAAPVDPPPTPGQDQSIAELHRADATTAGSPQEAQVTNESITELDAVIVHARAAVAHVQATRVARRQAAAEAGYSAVCEESPGYWADTEVEL